MKYSKAKQPTETLTSAPAKTRDIAIPMFGYKNHAGIDRAHGFIREWTVTSAAAQGLSGISCTGVLLNICVYALAAWKRSAKRTANWDFAIAHSLAGIFHSFSDLFKTR